MSQKPDPRPEAARAALAEAMVSLVSREDTESERISVSAVCAEAGVSRPTFYRYFRSVDDVLAQAIKARLDTLGSTFPESVDTASHELPEAVARIMTEVWRERPLYRQVLRPSSPYSHAKQAAQSWVEAALTAELGDDARANTRVVFAAGGVLACLAMLVESDDLDSDGIQLIAEELFAIMSMLGPKVY